MDISFFNNFNFFKSQETINVLCLDSSGLNYPFALKFSSKPFDKMGKQNVAIS